MKNKRLSITSYNIHKGRSAFNRTTQIDTIAQSLQEINSDIIFLQEVQGLNTQKGHFPEPPHNEILAQRLQYYDSYGKNAIFKHKHHGNAILSRTPIQTKLNINISTNQLEQRGMLHCQITPLGWNIPAECFCVHLNLMEQDRQKQYAKICDYFNRFVDPKSPIILAGDFNDWTYKSHQSLKSLQLVEVFLAQQGFNPKTFPSKKPLISLDRIFVKNLKVIDTYLHQESPWNKLSDHLPITAVVSPI